MRRRNRLSGTISTAHFAGSHRGTVCGPERKGRARGEKGRWVPTSKTSQTIWQYGAGFRNREQAGSHELVLLQHSKRRGLPHRRQRKRKPRERLQSLGQDPNETSMPRLNLTAQHRKKPKARISRRSRTRTTTWWLLPALDLRRKALGELDRNNGSSADAS